VSFGVTANPTAEWISRQVTEAFPWDHAPRYLIGDRDTYGPVFLQRIRAMGIRDHPITPRSPGKNAYVPVEQPTNFELAINLKVAQTLGLTTRVLVIAMR
jgi:hypothetical protein